ncbi:unnamed protein product [Mycena citricolor]|uniref:GAR domain-containing protein n=1 Tax=Mycena citricolor TaxID=2018698 RepID=A0AAD2JVM9_9AGAR|nr:unnamed protein product [Mycena citricolor]
MTSLDPAESSGTAPASGPSATTESGSAPTTEALGSPTVEQSLEWHEVISLKTFSERKVWIEDKTKFLEQLPPIEVFVGMSAIRESAEQVPGLPTREELQRWLKEHDTIEKETEIFDSGELRTIKKFTKAATQRNLSPQDTDLIELTLTTIYSLDKLLHLLRDRSDNLELLGIRLTWEEHRIAAWADRREILSDIKTFLQTRALWSPAVYDSEPAPAGSTQVLTRRASLASIASSDTSYSLASVSFSRSARYKLAELLARDAAHFSARMTALRHTRVGAAGKMLDRLIDTSRKPVPEELLDEQDRLEEKGIAELEGVGKFVMAAVMQWRKADEFYIDSLKDQAAAQALWDEIEAAKFQHPTIRQSTTFVHRAESVSKRLVLRGDPNGFPRPTHALFPEYTTLTESVTETLAAELSAAQDLTKKVEGAAREYRLNYEAVNRVELLVEQAKTLCAAYESAIERLEKGVSKSAGDGDGSPPDLTREDSLDPTRHAAFLALLPSILRDLDTASESTAQVMRDSRGALLALSVDNDTFKSASASVFQQLSGLRGRGQWTRDDVTGRVDRLREARRIWGLMQAEMDEMGNLKKEIADTMERCRWQQQAMIDTAPPTPESFSSPLPEPAPEMEMDSRLDALDSRLEETLDAPLATLSKSLEVALQTRLQQAAMNLKSQLSQIRAQASLLEQIKMQTSAMTAVRSEFAELQSRIEELRNRVDLELEDGALSSEELKTEVEVFTVGLTGRVLFIASPSNPTGLSFDPRSLDTAVRSDSNSYAITLAGQIQALEKRTAMAQLAKRIDSDLAPLKVQVDEFAEEVRSGTEIELLQIMAESGRISSSLSSVRDMLTRDDMLLARARALEELETELSVWVGELRSRIQQAEKTKLEEEERERERVRVRLDQERRLAEEQAAAAAAAEAARIRAEQEKDAERMRAINDIRDRLRSLGIEALATSSYLPDEARLNQVISGFRSLEPEASKFSELHAEIAEAGIHIAHLRSLVRFLGALHRCDAALSDLLEHIDSYPDAPVLSSSSTDLPLPERLSFTAASIDALSAAFADVKSDERATTEKDRVLQTWTELEEMARDRIGGRRSRAASVLSSTSTASIRVKPKAKPVASNSKSKTASYAGLSAGKSPSLKTRMGPPAQTPKRPILGPAFVEQPVRRPSSQLSTISVSSSSYRSISGPVATTFASRQRTASLTPSETPRRSSSSLLRPPPQRIESPSVSEFGHMHSHSHSHSHSYGRTPSRASVSSSNSTWARAPRYSLPKVTPPSTPQRATKPPVRKKYIANPKSKLDVAVGDVINKLPVGISIESLASEGWRDQSGKYWIGDQDPKLCFCRILRSSTVMVRVGGGWQELSKFIKDHFADSFRLMSENDSPPRGSAEPKWISSATLLEEESFSAPTAVANTYHANPYTPPRTPEPRHGVPKFQLVTPEGKNPQSITSSPGSKNGSPLTPLQFIRRADPTLSSTGLAFPARPGTPSKPMSHASMRTRTMSNTPVRNSVWRP